MSDQPPAEAGQYIEANGLRIHYTEQGTGRPLVLIHGGAVTGDMWEHYVAEFAQHFRVIMPDSRAHGRTNNPSGTLSFGLMAEDVAALIAALELQKPFVCGYSDGGQVALELGMRYPDLARAFVIGGAYAELTEGSKVWLRSFLGDPDSLDIDTEAFERDNADFVQMLRANHQTVQWPDMLRQLKPMWNAILGYTPNDFARITAPTLIVMGDRDGFVTLEEGLYLYRALPNAEYAVIPNADHLEMIITPRYVALARTLILDFLLRHDADVVNP